VPGLAPHLSRDQGRGSVVRRILPIGRIYASLIKGLERFDTRKSKTALEHERTAEVLRELKRARGQLESMNVAEARLAPAIRALRRIEQRLERPLRIAVIGEFNSGKSTLTNLLVRIESVPTAVVSNTCIATLLYHAPKPEIFAVYHDGRRERLRPSRGAASQDVFRLEVGLPSERLRTVQIVDLPGLADARFDDSIAGLAVHAVDAALWCTLSTQAWKESERAAWDEIPARLRGRGMLVATHRDLLRDASDVEKLLERLRDEAGAYFRNILPLSSVEALAVVRDDHQGAAGAMWTASGAAAFETALEELLQSVRMQRLNAALEVTARIARQTLSRIGTRSADSPVQ
jgi:GTPase SAR1 family protein